MRPGPTAATAAFLSILLVACGGPARSPSVVEGQIVDGWPIGAAADCSKVDCPAYLEAATKALGTRDAGHPGIVGVALREEVGGAMMRTTPCCHVAVFELADGSVSAIGVGKNMLGDLIVTVERGP